MIKVEAIINADIEKVWNCWNSAAHITQWCFASDDWHAPQAVNDLKVGGNFVTTMAAKDGSFSFDFGGIYSAVEKHSHIAYTMGDGRKVEVHFAKSTDGVVVTEMFEPESQNSEEMQQAGWQAILNNFKKHVESV